jgi:hypothetical protein
LRQAVAAEGRRARIEFHENQRGQYTNVYLDKVEPTGPAEGKADESPEADEVAWKTAIDAAPDRDRGIAAAMTLVFRLLGMTIGISMLTAIAAKTEAGPCVTHIGPGGAGHYVKMIHNGIEYGLMQSYAEGYEILHASRDFKLDLRKISELWQQKCGA